MDLNPDIEKTSPLPKFTILIKNALLINLRVVISNIKIIFLKLQPKNTQMRRFWFLFHMKLYILTNLRVSIPNMKILFFKFQPKITKKSIFGFKVNVFLFWMELSNFTSARVLISNMAKAFYLRPKNTQIT